jgi:hypothetical protein
MRPSELKTAIADLFKAGFRRALYVTASPGVGKTEIAGQVAKELGIGFKVIHAPLLQPEDYGFPVISTDRKNVDFVVSTEKFPLVGSDCPDTGILLIDELPQSDASAQKILANLFSAREIHGKRLKDGWMLVATGNRVTDRAGASRLQSQLANRATQVELEVSIEDWTDWALNNNIKVEVISFIRFRPELLNAFDAQADVNATPRAWAMGVSDVLGSSTPGLEFELFKGAVGEGAAASFTGFLRICRDLPSLDVILMDPLGAPVPDDSKPEVCYALCGALAHKTDVKNFGRIMDYMLRLPPEFQALYIKDALKLTKDAITGTKEFIQWATKHGSKLYSAKSS